MTKSCTAVFSKRTDAPRGTTKPSQARKAARSRVVKEGPSADEVIARRFPDAQRRIEEVLTKIGMSVHSGGARAFGIVEAATMDYFLTTEKTIAYSRLKQIRANLQSLINQVQTLRRLLHRAKALRRSEGSDFRDMRSAARALRNKLNEVHIESGHISPSDHGVDRAVARGEITLQLADEFDKTVRKRYPAILRTLGSKSAWPYLRTWLDDLSRVREGVQVVPLRPQFLTCLEESLTKALNKFAAIPNRGGRPRDSLYAFLLALRDLYESEVGRPATVTRNPYEETYSGGFFEFARSCCDDLLQKSITDVALKGRIEDLPKSAIRLGRCRRNTT